MADVKLVMGWVHPGRIIVLARITRITRFIFGSTGIQVSEFLSAAIRRDAGGVKTLRFIATLSPKFIKRPTSMPVAFK